MYSYGFSSGYSRRVIAGRRSSASESEFARIYCETCKKSMLLPFSCKGRWFCPSCHEKKVLLFGEFITGTIAFPVPHRQYVFSLPIMLRVYFRNNRQLLKRLCCTAK